MSGYAPARFGLGRLAVLPRGAPKRPYTARMWSIDMIWSCVAGWSHVPTVFFCFIGGNGTLNHLDAAQTYFYQSKHSFLIILSIESAIENVRTIIGTPSDYLFQPISLLINLNLMLQFLKSGQLVRNLMLSCNSHIAKISLYQHQWLYILIFGGSWHLNIILFPKWNLSSKSDQILWKPLPRIWFPDPNLG